MEVVSCEKTRVSFQRKICRFMIIENDLLVSKRKCFLKWYLVSVTVQWGLSIPSVNQHTESYQANITCVPKYTVRSADKVFMDLCFRFISWHSICGAENSKYWVPLMTQAVCDMLRKSVHLCVIRKVYFDRYSVSYSVLILCFLFYLVIAFVLCLISGLSFFSHYEKSTVYKYRSGYRPARPISVSWRALFQPFPSQINLRKQSTPLRIKNDAFGDVD